MSTAPQPNAPRVFLCTHCHGKIQIPHDLPPTTGPCPLCGATVTSPPLPTPAASGAPAQEPSPTPPSVIQPPRQLPLERLAPITQPAPSPPPAKSRRLAPTLWMILLFTALILAAAGTLYYVFQEMRRPPETRVLNPATAEEIQETLYLQSGWQADAYRTLDQFITAETAAEKLPYIIDPDVNASRVREFYGDQRIDDTSTPAESFTVLDLEMEDRKRGLFLLTFDQPPQFRMHDFFLPLAPLEVDYELEEADLLLKTMARLSNFAMKPVKIHAFFKRTPDGLKLDWDLFIQTKHRTFWEFLNTPKPELPGTTPASGTSGVFRVVASEDVPAHGRDVPGFRTYRLTDPANGQDSVRVDVPVDSEIGRILSTINWRGSADASPVAKTATVELGLTWGESESPVIAIKRFICWEFLGLGGQESPATSR